MNLIEKLKRHKQLLPLLLLSVYAVIAVSDSIRGKTTFAGEEYEYGLEFQNYIGLGAIVSNFLVYFFLRRFYKYTLTITIAVGLFNLARFSALDQSISFGINGSKGIGLQPSALLATLLVYFVNFRRINRWIFHSIKEEPTLEETKQQEAEIFREETEIFKERYKNHSYEALVQIVAENRFVPAAIEAAKQLLVEKHNR